MHGFQTATSVLAWIVAVGWLGRFAEAAAGSRRVPNLWCPEFDRVPEGNPLVAVIVPARNEAANVSPCITSLLGQDYLNVRIIAVNDRSTDRTGSILDQLAASDRTARLKVLHIGELPTEWLGKTHAMAVAAQEAIESYSPVYLLFTDADIQFSPDALRRSLVACTSSRADHFITLPTTIAKTWGEAVLLALLQVLGVWAVRNWRVADPEAKRDAMGVGAFNLLRTEVYEQVGGFESLKLEIVEDLMLGRLVKRSGFRQQVAIAPGMVSLHWAAGIAGIIRGMTKNFFAVFEYRVIVVLAATLFTALVCLAPALLLALPGCRLAGMLAWLGAAGLYALSARISRISPWFALSMPLGAVLVVYAMLRSTLLTLARGGVIWRGTFYALKDLRQHRAKRLNLVTRKSSRPV